MPSPETTHAVPARPRWRRWAGPLATVVTTLALTLLLQPVWLLLVLALQTYDSSGQGGPFRSCTADSVSCAGPNVPWVIGLIAVLLAASALAALFGRALGRYPRRGRAFLALLALSAATAAAAMGALVVAVLHGLV